MVLNVKNTKLVSRDVFRNDTNKGHRQRLKSKFCLNPKALFDYEILEMLLFYVIPRKDTKPLAKQLLAKFGTLKSVLFSSANEISKVKEIGKSAVIFFGVLKEAFSRISLQPLKEKAIIQSDQDVITYYANELSSKKKEEFRALFINNRNKLIAEESLQNGTVDQVFIYRREVVEKALEYKSSAIIIVHNHPSGDSNPSREDIVVTRDLKVTLEKLGIKLLDHIIIAENSSYSFASHNLL